MIHMQVSQQNDVRLLERELRLPQPNECTGSRVDEYPPVTVE